ncbi:efflux RND transporter permease subunit [Melioribacteraceae bacterium 4301-Me]|uniref:efflux RND transporter permease subunit n=1 Tax=Pyranulibacter aquaticus TaxID=3163344 RepID=UPI003596CE56
MKKVFYTFLTRPVTTTMFFFSVVVVGIVSIFNLPVELTPHVEYPRLTVSVFWPGVSPEAVEAYLTSPIEAELATLNGLKKISSTSSQGYSTVTIEFHPSADINFARVQINEKLSSLKKSLPDGISSPSISQYIPKDFENLGGFLTYSISANRSANEVRKYLLDNVVLKLKNIDGVSNVEVKGGSERLIEIIIDYNKAKSLDINNEEINTAVLETQKILLAGKIESNNSNIFLKIDNHITQPSTIGEQVVKKLPDGSSIRIKDIATIIDDYDEPLSYYRINGKETVTLIIDKELGANTLSVAKLVKEKINDLAKSFPADFNIIKEIDRSEDISKDLNELYKDSIFSLIIILVIIFLLFKNLRFAFIIILSILFSLLASFALFYLFNLTLNIITISCFVIGFGFIVDNSIVVIDYLDKHYDGRGEKYLTILVKDMFLPLLTSTTTIIAVFLPLIFLTGELQLYFKQFALGIGFTLFASLLVSFVVVPMLFLKTYKANKNIISQNTKENILLKIYYTIAEQVIKRKKLCLLFLILVIGLPVWLLPSRIDVPIIGSVYNFIFDSEEYHDIKPYINYSLGGVLNLFFNHVSRGELWNYGETTYIYVRLELPNGNRIERINKLSRELENEILEYKKNFKTLTANVINEETAILNIEFTPEQANSAFPYILKNYITAYITRLGGVDSYVYGFGPGFSNTSGGYSSMYNVEVKGYNYEKVKSLAENFRDKIKINPRIDNVDIDKTRTFWAKDTYEIQGNIQRDKLAAFGVDVNDLFSIIAKNTAGNFSYNVFRIDNEAVQYRVKFSNYSNIQLEELKNLIVTEGEREKLKVKDLINFQEKKVLSSINRVDQQYVRYISFEYKGPYKYGKNFMEQSIASINIPEGYSIKPLDFLFLFSEEDEIDIWKILGAAVIVIFIVTSIFLESFKKPLVIILAIPYAIVGAILLFWLTDSNIDRGAYAGMLLLVGLSVSNSVVLVNYFSKYSQHQNINLIQLVKVRLRAITSTALTTFGALIPFMLTKSETFWKHLSISIAGGIIVSYFFIILFLPLIYSIIIKEKK